MPSNMEMYFQALWSLSHDSSTKWKGQNLDRQWMVAGILDSALQPFTNNNIDDNIAQNQGNVDILPPLLKAFRRHRPQLFAESVAFMATSRNRLFESRSNKQWKLNYRWKLRTTCKLRKYISTGWKEPTECAEHYEKLPLYEDALECKDVL